MKKINYPLVLFFLIPTFLFSQNTSSLLVKAVEQLPDEGTAVTQSIKIKNLEQINSDYLEYSPVLYKNGILFTSNRKSDKQTFWNKVFKKKSTKLFYAEKIKEGEYGSPVPLPGKINRNMSGGAITVDESGNFMVYTVNNKKGENGFGLVELKLYSSIFQNGKWSKGEELPLNCEGCTTCHPSLSADSKTLYFASNRPGGLGGMDLYKSEFVDEKWGTPVNLGSKINSSENEVFPFINQDGTLYFSSNGKGGFDNLDIFFSHQLNEGEWKQAINIGQPFNSSADDFGFYIEKDGLSGLFSSNREGGKGKDDIYFWRMDQSLEQALDPSPVKFTIVDEETGDILPFATVSLLELKDINFIISEPEGLTAFIGKVNKTFSELLGKTYAYQTDEEGNFYHDLKHDKKYMIVVEKEDYKSFQKMTTYNLLSGVKDISIALVQPNIIEPEPQYKTLIDLAATEEIDDNGLPNETDPVATNVNNVLPKDDVLKEGQKITLDNIYYEYNKSELKSESTFVLDEIAEMLKNFPKMEIDLVAHTDARGKAGYNKTLSQERANAAKNYLISNGVEAERVTAIGLGEAELINDCVDGIDCSEELHSQNRRTEIVITKLKAANEIFVKKE